MILLEIIFWIFAFIIVWAMAGYDVSLRLIKEFKRIQPAIKTSDRPTVTVMIVAHNEEKVIRENNIRRKLK